MNVRGTTILTVRSISEEGGHCLFFHPFYLGEPTFTELVKKFSLIFFTFDFCPLQEMFGGDAFYNFGLTQWRLSI